MEPCCVLSTQLSKAQSQALAKLMKALSDKVRVRLLSLVATAPSREVCACDFPAALGKSQPTIRHHLSQLFAASILLREQRGKWAWFKVGDGLSDLRTTLADTSDEQTALSGRKISEPLNKV